MRRSEIESRPIAHVEIQPMIGTGEHVVMALMEEAEYYNVCFAAAGIPAIWDRSFDDIDSALAYILSDPKFSGSSRWYNGNEIMEEIASKDDLFLAIFDSEFYDEEGLVDIGEKLGFCNQEVDTLIAGRKVRRSRA